MPDKKIPVHKDTEIGLADILIMGAEILSEAADIMGQAEAKTTTRLKSTGKRYETQIIVTEVEDQEE